MVMTTLPRHLSVRESPAQHKARYLAQLACNAMVAEAVLTPKPGLVDGRGAGSHTDLTLELMVRSACAIEPFFAEMGVLAKENELCPRLREELAVIGRAAEKAMFLASAGTNTHK